MRDVNTNASSPKLLGYFLLWLAIFCSSHAYAVTEENAVKAGFVYNFTKFVDWPIDTRTAGDFNLCVVGHDQLRFALDALQGKSVEKRHIVLKHDLGLDDIKACQMVYIAKSEHQHLHGLLQLFTEHQVLTVSDVSGFAEQGGMIGLIRDGKHVGFEVNLEAVNAAGLRVSAQLLKLAKRVKGNQR